MTNIQIDDEALEGVSGGYVPGGGGTGQKASDAAAAAQQAEMEQKHREQLQRDLQLQRWESEHRDEMFRKRK
jgi:hypothetical protein